MRIIVLLALVVFYAVLHAATSGESTPRRQSYVIHPIGAVEINGDATLLRIDEEYAEAPRGLDQFSHVWVF
ncbi:MAG: hypothetical protein JXQ73_14750 [Phycisphaerae bacterium]|nr:hypothetical protein [Phycisphaerae bacterium]